MFLSNECLLVFSKDIYIKTSIINFSYISAAVVCVVFSLIIIILILPLLSSYLMLALLVTIQPIFENLKLTLPMGDSNV
jgi:hypothetical protein